MNGLWIDKEIPSDSSTIPRPNPPENFPKVSALRSALNRGDASQLAEAIGAARRWRVFWVFFGVAKLVILVQVWGERTRAWASRNGFAAATGARGSVCVGKFCVSQVCGQNGCLRFLLFCENCKNLVLYIDLSFSWFDTFARINGFSPIFCTSWSSLEACTGGGQKRVAAACGHRAEWESRRAVAALHGGGRTAELHSGPEGEMCCVAYRDSMHWKDGSFIGIRYPPWRWQNSWNILYTFEFAYFCLFLERLPGRYCVGFRRCLYNSFTSCGFYIWGLGDQCLEPFPTFSKHAAFFLRRRRPWRRPWTRWLRPRWRHSGSMMCCWNSWRKQLGVDKWQRSRREDVASTRGFPAKLLACFHVSNGKSMSPCLW